MSRSKNPSNTEFVERMERPGTWGDGVRNIIAVMADSNFNDRVPIELSSGIMHNAPVCTGRLSSMTHYV